MKSDVLDRSRKAISSGVARGRIPGSEHAVRRINEMTVRKRMAANTGTAGLSRLVR